MRPKQEHWLCICMSFQSLPSTRIDQHFHVVDTLLLKADHNCQKFMPHLQLQIRVAASRGLQAPQEPDPFQMQPPS